MSVGYGLPCYRQRGVSLHDQPDSKPFFQNAAESHGDIDGLPLWSNYKWLESRPFFAMAKDRSEKVPLESGQ
jgi:hypothetical protein